MIEPIKLQFPTMLRKMWSGGEVQKWLDNLHPLYPAEPALAYDVACDIVKKLGFDTLLDGLNALQAAQRTLERLGYTYHGGEFWKPPLGVAPPAPADASPSVLAGVVELANDAHAHWDAGRDSKVGKILLALAGHAPRYDPRADALHAAIQGEKA